MGPKVSAQFLTELRNDIPIGYLISYVLNIPCKRSEGHFRFLCHECRDFRTAINVRTNLSRCFLCEKNFNSIDLVMAWQKVNFLKAVEILSPVLAECRLNGYSKESFPLRCNMPQRSREKNEPERFGEILQKILGGSQNGNREMGRNPQA